MKTIRETLANLMPSRCSGLFRWRIPALALPVLLAAAVAAAQPANDNFASATAITGLTGTTGGDNSLATLESCETNSIDTPEYPSGDPQTNSVWFAWTSPTNGIVEFNTEGSVFDAILSVWTDTNAVPSLCDGSITNILSDDYSQITYSQVSFIATVGVTYYISVASWDDGSSPFDNAGNYALNWLVTVPVVHSGAFQFTSSLFTASQDDSDPPLSYDADTVSGVPGAQITITRPAPAFGRVLVDYAVTDLIYTNVFFTNFWGTNYYTTFITTNGVVSITNQCATNIVAIAAYEYYNAQAGFQYQLVTNAFTNSAYEVMVGVKTGTNQAVLTPFTPVWTNLPEVANYEYTTNFTTGSLAETWSETVYGYLFTGRKVHGTNYLDGVTITNNGLAYANYAVLYTNAFITNWFGTNLSVTAVSSAFNGPYYSTNFFYTNMAVGLVYATNAIYTNGPLVYSQLLTGTNWEGYSAADVAGVASVYLNASNYTAFTTPYAEITPAPTNFPPTEDYTITSGINYDSSSNELIYATNYFSYLTVNISTVVSASAEGIQLGSGTLTFTNLQMSVSIVVPVSESFGPNAPNYIGTAGAAELTLSNPRLDPQEDPTVLQAPTVSPTGGTAILNVLSPLANWGPGEAGPGGFNFERSTFMVTKNVPGTNAIISVFRVGGKAEDSVSVDYIIDPAWPGYSAIAPHNDFDPFGIVALYYPANTFPLQAGSDYATADTDFGSVSGTLNWGAYDYTPKQITIPIINNGAVEFNEDLMIQLHNALPIPTTGDPGMLVGQINQSFLTVLFDGDVTIPGGQFPGQQPAGAVDRSWNQDEAPDTTPPFVESPGTTPGPGGTVYALAEQPDGSAILAGSFVSYDGISYNRIVRVLSNGDYDSGFQGLFDPYYNSGANDTIRAMALQPDGRIIIGGNFTAFNGQDRRRIARLNPDGSVDTSFVPGSGANGEVAALALQPNGQIIIAGSFSSYDGNAANAVARLNADGSLDTSFKSGTLGGTNVVVDAVSLDSSSRVLIGGNFVTVAGTASGAVARLNTDGSLDTSFTPGIGTFNPVTEATDPVYAIAVETNGLILIGGAFSDYNLTAANGITRLNPDGTLDLTFHAGTGTLNPNTGNADSVNAILLQPDGNILIGGNFESYNQTRRVGFARIFTDGSLDTSFMDTSYNQFAGIPNMYLNGNVIAPSYPFYNTRGSINAFAVETNPITTASNILIGGTFEMVGGGYTRDDIHPRANIARVIGGATPGPGNIQMINSFYSANNSDGTKYVSLMRTNGNLGPVTATFSVNTAGSGAGVATAGVDFSPSVEYPTYESAWALYPIEFWDVILGESGPNYYSVPEPPARPTQADVVVNVFNPGNISGNLSAIFNLSAPVGDLTLGGEFIPNDLALGANYSAPFTIIDSNVKAGVLGFSSPTYSDVQGAKATITVTRTNGSANQVTVWYATSDGTATNGVDYVGTTNQLTFAAGATNATISITTLNRHTSVQSDKTVNLRLFTPGSGATLGLSNATLAIVNTVYSPGVLAFSQTNYSFAENAGNATITVNRLGGSSGTLAVTFLTANGTAASGINYIGTNTVLKWNNGDATSRTLTIPVLDDGVVTPNLVANLILTNSLVDGTNNSGPLAYGNAASPTNATLTVVNSDSAGAFQFSLPTYSVKKYAGYALVPVMRLGGSVGTSSVSFTTADGTGTNGADYVLTTNTLVFKNGQVSTLVRIPIINSGTTNNPSGPRSVSLVLGNATGNATLGLYNPATLYIIDSTVVDETPGTYDNTYSTFAGFNSAVHALTLQSNNQLVAAGDFTMANGVTRNRIARLNSDGSLDSSFSLPSYTYGADGSVEAVAIQADGRILVGGFFTNINSVARGRIARLNADGTLDSLFNPGSGADNPVYAVAQTSVNGVGMVLIGGSFASVSGNTANSIARLGNDGTPDSTFNPGGAGANSTVYALAVQTDGKILIGGDFTTYNGSANLAHIARLNADGSTDTNFNATGTGANDSVRAIALQLDGKILIGGLFTNVNGVVVSHVARLNANGSVDTGFQAQPGANGAVLAIGVQTDTRIVLGGEFTTYNGVTRNYITRLNPDGTIDPSINFGLGANGVVNALAIQEDTIYGYPTNVPDEKIILGGGFTDYNSDTYDDITRVFGGSISGAGAFEFGSASYQVDEDGVSALITVLRTGGTSNGPAGDITVNAFTSDGTAKAGVNYTAVTTNLDFPLGEVVKRFSVPVMDDGVITPDLTVDLAVANPSAPAGIGDQPTAVLTIGNVDSGISLSSSLYSVAKNTASGAAPISLIRWGGTNTTATVVFSTTTNGSAVIGTDYTPTNLIVTFAPGVSNVTVNIPITDNGLAEGNRTVTMLISNVVGSTLLSPTNATLTIIDTVTSPGQLCFAGTNFATTSDAGVFYLPVVRTNGTAGSVGVSYVLMPSGSNPARPGVDYDISNGRGGGTLTFGSAIGTNFVPVYVLNGAGAQSPVTLTAELYNATNGASLVQPTNATLTIVNDNAVIFFTAATNVVPEDASSLTVVVERTSNTNTTSTVQYATVNGTAKAGVNYSNTFGTLIFGPGSSYNSITIPLINQSNLNTLTFGMNLFNPSNAFVVVPSNTVVELEGSAAGISLTTNSVTIQKGYQYLPFTVVCSNPRVEPTSGGSAAPLSVRYLTVDGTAKAGVNYNAVSGTLFFTNGVGTNKFTVPILNPVTVSSNLTFSVLLTNVTAPGHITPYGAETVNIQESYGGFYFSQSSYTVYKNAAFATITVDRNGYTNTLATVQYSVTNGTAISGQNFWATNGTLTFAAGVGSQTFNVALIANSQVQPDLYAIMQLSNPSSNSVIASPGAAVLAILENGGSYIQPSGAMLVSSSSTTNLANDVIGSNDTVQIRFAFRDAAGLNVTNLIAYLQATNGVFAPSPTSQVYGPLTAYGHSVSETFTFSTRSTNTYSISPTFLLYDNGKYIGPATFSFTIGTWTTTFANTNKIVIKDGLAASPYPSIIQVTNIGGTLVKVTMAIANLSHQNFSDIDALLVSPTTNTLLMGEVGLPGPVKNVTLTFDDAATNSLPHNATIVTGTNKPTSYGNIPNFP